jgi:2-polyprenyl-3-methyl-5-hydroxy-6-metoxy-1,4-benzoquinol methylase
VFVPTNWHLDPDSEKAQYDLHQNDLHDEGYRVFLSRLASPLMARLPPGASGLDFGCGPGPALAQILRDAGFKVALYDKFYAPDEGTLTRRFDFITATEVVEHLRRPGWELERLWSLLSSRGWLGIMTKLVRDPVAFAGWHYKNDSTHVCFYSADTWRWWAAHHGASLEIIGSDVILLRREA